LVACGVWEAVTYVTASADHLESFSDGEATGFLHRAHRDRLVKLKNPLQADRSVLRPTLIPALVEAVASNLKHADSVRLGELARIYLPHPSSETMDGRPLEIEIAAVAIAGRRDAVGIYTQAGDLDFFDLKGILHAVLSRLGLTVNVEPAAHAALHPGRAASFSVEGIRIALLGELRPDVAARFGVDDARVTVAELDLSSILPLTRRPRENITVPRFLPVEQDFAIVVDEATPADSVGRALLESARPLATDAVLFDIYRGAQIGDGKKSLAYRVSFTAPDRALTDAELVKVRSRIERTLKQRVSGTLRS
ncbi:MAG: phenylalanine--tRNA ligase subunit beta, partial [Thermomicrobiales bacterium]